MSIETRIQAINDHLVDDYKVLRLAGADLSGVNKNIVNLKMSWKERLLYFMNNGTQEVWNNWTKVSGTGTTLSLNNTEEAPMSLTYKGNTSQTGTPTPSSPIPVQVVSGDNSIEVKGKNLCDLGTISDYIPASRVRSIDDNVMSIRVFDAGETYAYKTNQNYEGNMTYTFSSIASSPSSRFYIRLRKLDDSAWMTNADVSISGWTYNAYYKGWFRYFTDTNISATTTIPNCLYWQIGFGYNSTGEMVGTTQTISNIQIEKGTTATTYEEYKSTSYPINLGVENLLNISSNLGRTTSNGITFVPVFNDDGTLKYISVNGTATATANMQLAGTQTLNGSYTLSSGIGINNNIYIQCLKTSDYTAALRTDLPYNTGTFSNVNVVTYLYVKNGTTANNIKIYPMIEKGLVEHSYNPYGKTPIELNQIGDYQDRIFKAEAGDSFYDTLTAEIKATLDTGSWYKYSAIGKVVLNENSNVLKYTGVDIGRYYISGITGLKGSASSPNAMSNYFNSAFSTSNGSIFVSSADSSINMINTAYNNDLAGFKTWLGTTNPNVYYVLATPTYETITDTTLIGQLETLKKSYEGQTNISQTNNDLPFELSVTALEVMS